MMYTEIRLEIRQYSFLLYGPSRIWVEVLASPAGVQLKQHEECTMQLCVCLVPDLFFFS